MRGYGDPTRHIWKLDAQNRITDGRQATTPIDKSAAKAVDEAVRMIAKLVLDTDEPDR